MAVKIKIDKALHERLAEAASRAGYASTGEFIEHVLEKAASEAGVGEPSTSDEQEVEKQLRGLGYIE